MKNDLLSKFLSGKEESDMERQVQFFGLLDSVTNLELDRWARSGLVQPPDHTTQYPIAKQTALPPLVKSIRDGGFDPDLFITSPFTLAQLMSDDPLSFQPPLHQETGLSVTWNPLMSHGGSPSSYVAYVLDSSVIAVGEEQISKMEKDKTMVIALRDIPCVIDSRGIRKLLFTLTQSGVK